MLLLFMTIRDNSVHTKVKNIKSTKLSETNNYIFAIFPNEKILKGRGQWPAIEVWLHLQYFCNISAWIFLVRINNPKIVYGHASIRCKMAYK